MPVLLREGQLLIPQVWRFGKGGSILECAEPQHWTLSGENTCYRLCWEQGTQEKIPSFPATVQLLGFASTHDLAELRHGFLLLCTICKVKIYGSWTGAVSLASKNIQEKLIFVARTQIIIMAFLYFAIILQFFWRWQFVLLCLGGLKWGVFFSSSFSYLSVGKGAGASQLSLKTQSIVSGI